MSEWSEHTGRREETALCQMYADRGVDVCVLYACMCECYHPRVHFHIPCAIHQFLDLLHLHTGERGENLRQTQHRYNGHMMHTQINDAAHNGYMMQAQFINSSIHLHTRESQSLSSTLSFHLSLPLSSHISLSLSHSHTHHHAALESS